MNSKLRDLISKILLVDIDQVIPDLKQDDLEDWDSMTHLVLISDIESEFDVSFTDEEVSETTSVGEIISLLESKGIVL